MGYRSVSYILRLERDAKLGVLEERADALQDGAAQFEKQAGALKNKFWLENMKAIVAGSIAGLLLLGLLYWKFFASPPAPAYPPQYAAPPPPAPGGAPAAPPSGEGGEREERSVYFTGQNAEKN